MNRYKYIVVEDETLIRRNIIKKVQSLPLPLAFAGEAANGQSGQGLIDTALPAIVLTDIRMPGCDGLELAKYTHEHYPKIKTVILTGHSDFALAQTAIKYQVFDYLLKPVSVETLHTTMQHLLVELDAEDRELSTLAVDPHLLSQEELCDIMMRYIRQNYRFDFSVGEMATKIGYSAEYLSKLFKKHTGITPSKYLAKLRLNEAKYLLSNQADLEVHTIGEMVGYKDAFYFSRVFKSHTGMYPSDYRVINRMNAPLI